MRILLTLTGAFILLTFFLPGCLTTETEKLSDETGKRFSFRIQAKNEVPQLTVNGKAIPPYIFFGNVFGSSRIKLSDAWQDIKFDFKAMHDDNSAILQVRFDNQSNEFWIGDVIVEDLTSGKSLLDSCKMPEFGKKWEYYYRYSIENASDKPFLIDFIKTADSTNEPTHIQLTRNWKLQGFQIYIPDLKIQKNHMYKARIRMKANAECFINPAVRGNGTSPLLYGDAEGCRLFDKQVTLAASQNVNIISFQVNAIWRDSETDYRGLEFALQDAMAANPNAWLLPRINMNPPQWWYQMHPEDMMISESGNKIYEFPEVSSKNYRKDACEALRRTIIHCEKYFGDRMAGYHPVGAKTGEWFYPEPEFKLYGYDSQSLIAWREWLSEKYKTDAALRKTWKNETVSIATANIPRPEARRSQPRCMLLNPEKSAELIDFNQFRQDSMSGLILEFAKTIRQAAGEGRLSVFFYGYLFELAAQCNGPASTGHYALRRLLNSKDIDILAGPFSYIDRGIGGVIPSMSAAESVTLSGKLWLNEDDTRTFISYKVKDYFRCDAKDDATTLDASIEFLRRNLCVVNCHNFATWWMDLGGSGWFNDPKLWEQMSFFKDMIKKHLEHPRKFSPEIAAILDEKSLLYVATAGTSKNPINKNLSSLIYNGRKDLGRIGAPYGQYLMDDVINERFSTKLRVFPAAYALSSKERRYLYTLSQKGATIWAWAPGYIDTDSGSFSLAAVKELTGFNVRRVDNNITAAVESTEAGTTLGLPKNFGENVELSPLLSPVPEARDIVLANYSDGSPAIVLRQGKESAVLFCGTNKIPTALYRHMARLGKVHLYTDEDACVYALGTYLAIYAVADTKLKADVGQPAEIWSVFEKKYIGNGPVINLSLRKGQIVLLRLDSNEKHK